MTGWECTGWVTSLRGETVLYTGTVYVDGTQMERRTLREQTRLMGGHVAPDQSSAVTVLVHGDLGVGRRLTDSKRGYSRKLVFVEKTMHESGRHIHVIDDLGFGELLHGRSATCHKLRSVGDGLLAGPPETGV
jgi:hypothetical protein